jgi:hypothetical protein
MFVAFVAFVALGVAAGCAGQDDPSVPAPDASAYAAALAPFMPPSDPDEQPKVFVAPFNEPLVLDDQVAIIELMGEGYDVTFVDDTATAVDADSIGRPVSDDGLLLVLGTIPPEPPYVVRVEAYRREDDASAQLVTLVWRADHWEVASQERVEPEAVIVDG